MSSDMLRVAVLALLVGALTVLLYAEGFASLYVRLEGVSPGVRQLLMALTPLPLALGLGLRWWSRRRRPLAKGRDA